MTDRNYGAIRDSDKAIKFIDKLIDDPKYSSLPIAFDIEAGYTGEDKEGVALQQFHPDYIMVGISFTVDTSWARYIPFAHDDGNNIDNQTDVARALWRMLQTGRGVAHNASYELKGMARFFRERLWNDPEVGAEVRSSLGFFPILADTMILVWLEACYDPLRVGKDLKSISKTAFGLVMTQFKDLFPAEDSELGPATKRGKTRYVRFNTRNSMSPKIIAYACEDSVAALMVYQKHIEGQREKFIWKTEMGLLPVLVRMETGPVDPDTGRALGNMLIDWNLVRRKSDELADFSARFNDEILSALTARLGRPIAINLASVKQLSAVLFDPAPQGLGLPVKVRSEKTEAPSTSDDALRVIAKTDPIIKKILTYRQVLKLNGSYLQKFLKDLTYTPSGVVFPNHNQAGALTGRMSVDQMSYQQWPKPYHFELDDGTVFELNFRDLLISPEDYRIVGYDFSQVELRVLAGQAREDAMLHAFANDIDIHKATASTMLRIPLEEVTKKQRGIGKTCNFAVVYGSGADNIADMLTAQGSPTTKAQAEELLEQYYAGFAKLRNWMDDKIATGREQGYVETLFGRKFTVWEFKSYERFIQQKGNRMCVNAPVQGGAADYMKIGMVRAMKAILEAEKSGRIPVNSIRLFMTVHDALEFYVHKSVDTQTVIDLITPCVSFPVKGLPEIKTDWHEGNTWGHVVEIELDRATKQISGYGWEDPSGESHTFENLAQAYAFQDAFDQAHEQKLKEKKNSQPDAVVPTVKIKQNHDPEISPDNLTPDNLTPDNLTPEKWDRNSVVSQDDRPMALLDEPESVEIVAGDAPWTTTSMQKLDEDSVWVVEMSEMPTPEQWEKFKAYLAKRPGSVPVRLETPEGNLTTDEGHNLMESEQGAISVILGGANLRRERVMEDLELEP